MFELYLMQIITLTTDFGNLEYVGAMKGVIYSICRDVRVVDITHEIKKFDIRRAAYVIYSTCKYFPPGTIHVAVVDPGVGTERKGIIVKARDHIYLGPDNGIFTFVEAEKIYEIKQKARSRTFHGRDIFAPIAARIACGGNVENFGNEIHSMVKIKFREPKFDGNKISGEVICVDDFGNVITNIKRDFLKGYEKMKLEINGKKHELRFVKSYGFARKRELVILVGSEDYVEIAVNQGDASKILGVQGGEKISLEFDIG